ncbi:Na+/H+ antiporter NhaC family protein [Leptolyngbyaceae cyanobacterium CCMR0082]|uniref:Na+/H+ antiporter NhaC family protein n=1 Tax=Adonisia turfae CCMR0082 TaxID=2304604 RepID=A0A6M0SHD3_9CYAN|nr:Na+/H+ antiporter NhaC family protein [Adonisia turfae]NEZ67022.1 Na+/H+ antiporter NhaC family protein [Adonisia turfae CCMR0082]
MDIVFGLLAAFALLLISALQGIALVWPLAGAIALFILIHLHRGYGLLTLLRFCWQGARQSWPVFSILLLIGALMSSWLAGGTVPALVYYGTQLIAPHYFVLSAFILTALVSTLLGTSFGAAGTIGLALMIMARSSGMPQLNLVAGAIIAGAYVGDRCSPLSSSAHLIATVTDTRIYQNLKQMLLTSLLPLSLTLLTYGIFSWFYPLEISQQSDISRQIAATFDLHGVTLVPALLVLALAAIRVNVKLTISLGWGVAVILAIGLQHYSLTDILRFTLWGFRLESSSELDSILLGGGLWPMLKVCAVVLLSTALSGLLSNTHSLDRVGRWLRIAQQQRTLFAGTTLISLLSGAFGCTQTITILLTHQLVSRQYKQQGHNAQQVAIDLENTAVVLAPMIPWNIAGLVPATLLMAGPGFIPFAVYLYLVPLCNWLWPARLGSVPVLATVQK